MLYNLFDTIVAVSTARGSGGIGIVRLSGGLSVIIACLLSKKKKIKLGLNYASFFDNNSTIIDKGLLLFFKKPMSFTGEDVIECHVHGNELILDNLVLRCVELGARLAYNGEFSFRAFINNKLDLVQAESINSLIKSNSLNSNKFIFKSLFGKFSDDLKNIILNLNSLKLEIEASIEFPDHVNLVFDDFYSSFFNLYIKYKEFFNNVFYGNSAHESLNVAILGKVNVGKSSLFNYLLNFNRSIVSDVPGTTRDFIESSLYFNGVKFNLIDTAGFNSSTSDIIESISIDRTFLQAKNANILIFVVDVMDKSILFQDVDFRKILEISENRLKLIILKNKIDLVNLGKSIFYNKNYTEIFCSVKTGDGIDLLLNEMFSIFNNFAENFYFVNKRQFDLLSNVKKRFDSLIINDNLYKPLDLYAEGLRIIISDLNCILGVDVSDDVLSHIFSNFCVGK